MKRAEIEERLLDWMRREPQKRDDARFETLALALFALQFERCPAYRKFATARGALPGRVRRWQEIPAVPTGAFKELVLCSFDAAATVKIFRSSGTTLGRQSALHLDTLELYEASASACFTRGLLPDLAADAKVRLLVLAPQASEAPDSSLSHMFELMRQKRGAPGSDFFVSQSAKRRSGDRATAALREDALIAALETACADTDGAQTLLCGTALAFVHALDALARRGLRFRLPKSARVMETGGFKGRAREIAQTELYARLADAFGVPATRIVNQYGMTELGSQFYDTVLCEPGTPRVKRAPPWVRVRVLDPATGAPAAKGEPGLLQIHDLANTGSVAALLTADLGRRLSGDDDAACAFELQGRAAGAEQRGCSIAADEMLDARV